MTALPPPESLLRSIKESCAACTARSGIPVRESAPHLPDSSLEADQALSPAQVDRQAIEAFISSIKEQDWTPSDHGVRMPLAFESVEDELNVLACVPLSASFGRLEAWPRSCWSPLRKPGQL